MPAKLHILLLNQPFYPDVVSTAQLGKDLADALVRRGHIVTAVASRSIHGKAGAALPAREPAPVFDGGPAPVGLIDIHRVGASLFGKSSTVGRVADFGLFYLLALIKVLSLPRADVVVSFTTPPFIAMVGLISRWLRGSRAIYWVMDLYPDAPVACGMLSEGSLVARVMERVSRFLLRRSDASVVLGRCMRERVIGKGVPAEKVKLISVWGENSPPPYPLPPGGGAGYRERWAPNGEFVVMYSGNFGLGHEAGTILGAIRTLKHESGIRFVFVGGGKRRAQVEDFIARHAITNAVWEDYQPRESLPQSLAAGDVHLISLREGAEGVMVPSKLYGIMAAGRPSVFVGNATSEIARVLAEYDAGVSVREGDFEALVRVLRELKADPQRRQRMGDSARTALAGRYDRETACRQWIELIEAVAAPAPAPDAAPASGRPAAP